MPEKRREEEEKDLQYQPLVRLRDDVIYFFHAMDGAGVMEAIMFLDELENDPEVKDITIKLSSGGGNLYDGLAFYDRIRSCKKHVTIIGTGLVASMAFMVYVAGDKRLCTPTVRFLNHQTKAGFDTEMTEAQLKIEAVETKKMEAECVDLIASRTFLTPKIIRNHIRLGDKYISAKEAVNMGIAHEIIEEVEKEGPKK